MSLSTRLCPLLSIFLLVALFLTTAVSSPGLAATAPETTTKDFLSRPEGWFTTPEAAALATKLLSYQSDFGGWPTNLDLTAAPFSGKPGELINALKPALQAGATTEELRFFARMFRATGEARYRHAVEQGLDYVLIAQYPTGGWPQFYPPDNQHHRYITFSEDCMVRVLQLLQEASAPGSFDFLDADRRNAAQIAFQRGIECVLRSQVKVNGKLTAWCAQHDDLDLSPRPGRAFEPMALAARETVGIVKLLMSLPQPGPEVIQAVEAAVSWLKAARIEGWRVTEQPRQAEPGNHFNAVPDAQAEPFWTRLYDIETTQPLWSDGNGERRLGLAKVGWARHGVVWTGPWATVLLEAEHPIWQARLARDGIGPAMPPWKPRVRIALAGDSTVTDPAGWGFGFKKALAAGVLCQNFARGGQSSKSFRDTGVWAQLLASRPEIVLIQFGHNDMPGKGPHRETDPATTYAENLRHFVHEVRDAGAKPVLVTSLVRRIFVAPPAPSAGGAAAETPAPAPGLRGELAPYAEAARRVATEMQVPLIDLYTLSFRQVVALGSEGVAPFEPVLPLPSPKQAASLPTPATPTVNEIATGAAASTGPGTDIDFPTATASTTRRDSTHLNALGSIEFGAMVARELVKVLPETKDWVQ